MSNIRCRKTFVFMLALMVSFCAFGFCDTDYTYAAVSGKTAVVKKGPLNVRSGPSTKYKVYGTLAKGKKITLKGTKTYKGVKWYKITYKSKMRYISAAYVSVGSSSVSTVSYSPYKTGVVRYGSLRVRSGPSTNYKKLGTLAKNTKVTIKSLCKVNSMSYPSWYKIIYKSGTGYVACNYVTIKTSAGSSASNTKKVISTAESKLGCAYVYGAVGPSSFDCSGFVYWVMNNCGADTIAVPRTWKTTYSSYAKYSIGTDWSKAQAGDIVVFSTDGTASGITHVAFYYGNGKIIHASTPSTGVCISNITYSLSSKSIIGIIRLPNM